VSVIRRLPAALLIAVMALGGCAQPPAGHPAESSADGTTSGNADGGNTAGPDPGAAPRALTEIRVFVPDSLAEAFDLIRQDFQAQNPSVELVHTYGKKESLTRRIAGGEPADVLVTDGGGRLEIEALTGEPEVATFVAYLREGQARRILTDTGVLRP
jgi:ABC-type molybdate transport system substrate-binding protein